MAHFKPPDSSGFFFFAAALYRVAPRAGTRFRPPRRRAMLTPADIKAHTFTVGKRGYDIDQVTEFLRTTAGQVTELQAKVEKLRESQPQQTPRKTPRQELPDRLFDDVGSRTRAILQDAYKAGVEIQREARQKAARELDAAYAEAAELVSAGQRRRETIEGVVEMLEQRRAALSGNLHAISEHVHELLSGVSPGGRLPSTDELLAGAVEEPALADQGAVG
jgi:DivIVA domain-containing protein